ncbi:MAG: lysozyme family protein [Candidatus Limivicinus sp.]
MKKANAPPTIKEKARLVFIREKASQMKEKSRHKYSVPGPFAAIDSARVIEHHDPKPEENSCAADRIEHKTLSKLSRAEMVVRYARHKQQRNVSHRETHFEPEPEPAPEAGEDSAEMRLTMRRISKPASPQDLMREKTVSDCKAKQSQKEYAASTPEAETLHSPEKADRPYRKTRETATARRFSRQQSSEHSQPTHKQAPSPKAQAHREQGRRPAQGTAIKESVQKQSRRDRRLRKLKAAVERAARASAQSALTAGGGLLLLVLPLLLLFGAVGALFGGSGELEKAPVSDEVKAYAGLIQLYAAEHGIPEYTELIMAVMMQESGGQGNDPMQASECAFNTKYPNTPGGITDPEYSIAVGIQNLAACLSQAGAGGPEDIDRVSLALQGYNFGSGYISWALANYGCYSELNALEFSSMMAQRLGWSSYGDPYYVQHVMRYYNITESESE